MLDFNAKKEVLRNLRAKRSKNKLMWLPCVIAELFVKLWYALLCTIDMALSDKHGNFLGVKRNKNRADKPKKRRQDDIVYVKRPFWGRFVSAVLAFSFVFMMVPDLGVFDFAVSAATNEVPETDLTQGQATDNTTNWFIKTEYIGTDQRPGAINATISDLEVIFANGCAKLSWKAPEGFGSNYSCTYVVGYSTGGASDQVLQSNYSGTSYTAEGLLDDTTYTFYVIPRISLSVYEPAYTTNFDGTKEPVYVKDSDGNYVLDANGEKIQKYYKTGDKYVEGVRSNADSGTPNGKITPSVSLSTIDFDDNTGEVILTWLRDENTVVNLTGYKPYGYAVYRCIMDYSNNVENYELIDYFSADSHLLTDGITVEYRDGTIQYGRVYKYYIKAYTNLFGGTQYIDNKPGIVTSGDHTVTTGKLTVSIPPAKVLDMQVISNGKDTLEVSWDKPKNSNVDGYLLFRSETEFTVSYIETFKTTNSKGETVCKYWDEETQTYDYYSFIMDMIEAGNAKELTPNGTEYEDQYSTRNQLDNDKIYYYYVIPYVDADRTGVKKLYGPMSSASGSIDAALASPQWDSVSTEDGKVTLKWKTVTGADGYRIYITKTKNYTGSTTGLGDKGYIDVGKVTSYTIEGLLNGDQYSYRLKAYSNVATNNTEDPTKLFSEYSDTRLVTIRIELDTPQDMKVTTKDGQNTVTWSAVQGADGYVLYYQCNGGTWKSIDLSKTTFNHTGLNNDDVYNYYVKAYKTIDKSYDENNDGKEQIVYSDSSVIVTIKVGETLDAPKDFTAETSDGVVNLSWTKVDGAEGYILYAYSGGRTYEFDVSKTKYEHTGLNNGDVWTYWLVAYKTVNGERTYSDSTQRKTVTIGVSLSAAVDLVATAGNHQIDLTWTKVNGAEGYVVYIYDESTMEFEALTVTSKTSYSHVGLRNGKEYTYMVAAFKTINGERYYGEYSMAVSATPTNGSTSDVNRTLTVKGTTPYGISHSEYISAKCNYDAFDESVDVYFTTNKESTAAVKDVLRHYAKGLSSFIIYPFDISIYKENTLIEVEPNDGYSVTVTMPVPDKLIAYRDYITVVHINEEAGAEEGTTSEWYEVSDQRLEVLPCAILDIDNVWCIQFVCSSFSPYAFVIYKEHINDVSAGSGVADGSFAGTFNSGVLLFTTLPDIMPENRKLRIVKGKKRYKVKNITTV